jgi:AcrR family transcriptional regulator
MAAGVDAAAPPRRAKRNLPAVERRRALLDAATEIFAECGLGITVQALADRVHVTQPLIHRYFPAKADLIAAIRDRIQNAHWDPAWRATITDRSRPLGERLSAFYGLYLPHIHNDVWYRGFMFASLADPGFAETYVTHVTDELLSPVVGEVRHEAGCPGFAEVPLLPREIELAWGMHSTMVFQGVRRYVYHSPIYSELNDTVRDQIAAYLLAAPRLLRELMPAATGKSERRRPK